MTHRHRARQRTPNSRKMIPTFCTTSRLVMIPRIDGNLSSSREIALAIRRPWQRADGLRGRRRNAGTAAVPTPPAVSVARVNASSVRKEAARSEGS
jgi:hypothetical protein